MLRGDAAIIGGTAALSMLVVLAQTPVTGATTVSALLPARYMPILIFLSLFIITSGIVGMQTAKFK